MSKIKFRTPKQVIKEWLKRLRSGEYTQIQGGLRESKNYPDGEPSQRVGYCCLGVLQQIAVDDGGMDWDSVGGPLSCDSHPMHKVMDYIGLDIELADQLISMNDEWDKDFFEIAEVVEEKLLKKA